MSIYTIGILGNSGSGKSTYLERLTTGYFLKEYIPTTKCKQYSHEETTTDGKINIIFKDIPPNDIEENMNDCHGFIIFYTQFEKFEDINGKQPLPPPKLYPQTTITPPISTNTINNDKYTKLCEGRDYVLFETKYDLTNRNYNTWENDKISMKTITNYELPLITLLRKITKNEKLDYYNENDY